MRVDKLLAHAGFGSRKDVRQLLKKKAVTVDNKVITSSSTHVNPGTQVVTVLGEVVNYRKYIYMMLHKPQNYVSATFDHHDLTVVDLVPEEYQHMSLAPVGRLDKDTEGLILLTNDGKLNHLLTTPKNNIWKTYFAKVNGTVMKKHVEEFTKGIVLDDGYHTKPAILHIIKSDSVSEVELSITEGKFHQVKRMFRALGMEVIYLKRIRIGNIYLDETLPLGKTRLLEEQEMAWISAMKSGGK